MLTIDSSCLRLQSRMFFSIVDRRHLVVNPDPTLHFAADPVLDPDPFPPASYTQVGKAELFKTFFYSNANLHCFMIFGIFLISDLDVTIFSTSILDRILKFSGKKDSLSLNLVKLDIIRIQLPRIGSAGPGCLSRSGYRSSKMMSADRIRIRIRIHNTGFLYRSSIAHDP